MKVQVVADARVETEHRCANDFCEETHMAEPDYDDLKMFDGVKANEPEDELTQYFWAEKSERDGKLVGLLTNGYMRFEYDDNLSELLTVTEFDTTRKLTTDEEEALISYCQGQWSDGLGEGFEQDPVVKRGEEYYIHAWHEYQRKPVVKYVEDT